ncbi:MAG: YybH family protein [Armatimonadota bacterium]
MARWVALATVALVFGAGMPVMAAESAEKAPAKEAPAVAAPAGDWLMVWTMNLGSAKASDVVKLFDSIAPDMEGKFPAGYLWHRFFVDEVRGSAGFVSGWKTQPSLERIMDAMPAVVQKVTDFFMSYGLTEADYTVRVLKLLPPKAAADDVVKDVVRKFFAAMASKDVDAALAFYTDDVEIRFEGPQGPNTISGKSELASGLRENIDWISRMYAEVPEMTVKVTGDTAVVGYKQSFEVPSPDGSGMRKMTVATTVTLKKAGDTWKISRAELKPSEGQ